MLKYNEYSCEEKDTCDIFDEQMEYVFALGLTLACKQLGK